MEGLHLGGAAFPLATNTSVMLVALLTFLRVLLCDFGFHISWHMFLLYNVSLLLEKSYRLV